MVLPALPLVELTIASVCQDMKATTVAMVPFSLLYKLTLFPLNIMTFIEQPHDC